MAHAICPCASPWSWRLSTDHTSHGHRMSCKECGGGSLALQVASTAGSTACARSAAATASASTGGCAVRARSAAAADLIDLIRCLLYLPRVKIFALVEFKKTHFLRRQFSCTCSHFRPRRVARQVQGYGVRRRRTRFLVDQLLKLWRADAGNWQIADRKSGTRGRWQGGVAPSQGVALKPVACRNASPSAVHVSSEGALMRLRGRAGSKDQNPFYHV